MGFGFRACNREARRGVEHEWDAGEQNAHSPVLNKPDSCRLLAEALSAEVKSVLADDTSLVGA